MLKTHLSQAEMSWCTHTHIHTHTHTYIYINTGRNMQFYANRRKIKRIIYSMGVFQFSSNNEQFVVKTMNALIAQELGLRECFQR